MASLAHIFFAELVGTFVFLSVIFGVVTRKEDHVWIKIGLTLAVSILFVGNISGGKLNPAVSLMFFMAKQTHRDQLIYEISAQILGALMALGAYYAFLS